MKTSNILLLLLLIFFSVSGCKKKCTDPGVNVDANFSATAANGNDHAPAKLNFSAENSYKKANYKWFVDGSLVSTKENLGDYVFTSAGTYAVRLEISCENQSDSQTYNYTINNPYTGVHIKLAKFWYPSGSYDDFWYQHYEDGFYTAQSYVYSINQNWTWLSFNDQSIFSGDLSIPNFNSVSQSQFDIWTNGGPFGGGGVVKTYTFSLYNLDDRYYPKVLNWTESNGFDFQVELEYY